MKISYPKYSVWTGKYLNAVDNECAVDKSLDIQVGFFKIFAFCE